MKNIFIVLMILLVVGGCNKSTIKKTGCSKPPLTGALCLPNIFSPNGDHINDTLFVRHSPGFSQIDTLEFLIKDGSGALMFSSTDPNVGWDGTYSGKVKAGVFQAIVKATLYNGETIDFVGTVTSLKEATDKYVINQCTECRFDRQFNGNGGFDGALPSGEPTELCK